MYKLTLEIINNGTATPVKQTEIPNHKLADVLAMMVDLHKIVPHDAIARKIWCPDDIKAELQDRYGYPEDVIEEKGLVETVLRERALQALGDCTDWDWEIIHQAIENAGIERYNVG